MATPAELVSQSFSQAQNYASSAQSQLSAFTTALNASIYSAPTISVTWNSLAPPTLPSLPTAPTLPTISFTAPTAPTAFAIAEPAITIDTFSEVAPTTTFPTAPTPTYGSAPTVPSIGTVTVPTEPTITLPSEPTYISITTPSFAGIDLHTAFLSNLETIPTLSLVAPTPYSYALGPEYASTLLTSLKATLNSRLGGGTGLNPAVEQAIWDRARGREEELGLTNEAEIARNADALGFHLPPGVLAAQLREAQKNTFDKLSGLSRDIAIKQADLEQSNLKDTIAAGMQLEAQLIDYSYKLEQLTFESAKTTAENAVSIYNAQVDQYKALLTAYQTYAQAYKTIIDGELAKVEVFKAEVDVEKTKAEINKVLVEQYKASIEASLATVEIYKAQVDAAKVLVELEGTKVSAAGEQIRAYVAQVNAETSKVEAYKATVQAEQVKVDIYKVKADAFRSRVEAQAEEARLQLQRFSVLANVKTQEWEGYRAQIAGETARMQALASQSDALVAGYRAASSAVESEANMYTRIWEGEIKNYEAGQQLAISTAKLNADVTQATNAIRLDAAKVGAQVYAQLTASAYSMINANASVSASANMGVSFNYSNDTATTAPTVTVV